MDITQLFLLTMLSVNIIVNMFYYEYLILMFTHISKFEKMQRKIFYCLLEIFERRIFFFRIEVKLLKFLL